MRAASRVSREAGALAIGKYRHHRARQHDGAGVTAQPGSGKPGAFTRRPVERPRPPRWPMPRASWRWATQRRQASDSSARRSPLASGGVVGTLPPAWSAGVRARGRGEAGMPISMDTVKAAGQHGGRCGAARPVLSWRCAAAAQHAGATRDAAHGPAGPDWHQAEDDAIACWERAVACARAAGRALGEDASLPPGFADVGRGCRPRSRLPRRRRRWPRAPASPRAAQRGAVALLDKGRCRRRDCSLARVR